MRSIYPSAIMVLVAASLWGTLGLFGKVLYAAGISPLEAASVRATIGFLGLAAYMAPRAERLRIRWRDLPFFAVYGLISIALFQFFYFAAIERTTISVAAALLYTAPAFVVVLARLTEGERLDRTRRIALGLVLAGVFLVTGAAGSVVGGGIPVSGEAVAFGLGSALAYGLYTLFGKRSLRRYDPIPTVFYAFGFGAALLSLAAPPWTVVARHAELLPILVALGLFPTIIAYLLYITGLRGMQAGTASMLTTVEPVVALVLGVAFLDESLGPAQGLGIAAIIAAALLLMRGSSGPRRR